MQITGRQLVITPAMRRHVESRLARLDRYDVRIAHISVILGVNKLQHTAEVVCTLQGKRVQAKVSTQEMYASIDQAIARLEAQIRKRKERLVDHKGMMRKRAFPSSGHGVSEGADDVDVMRISPPTLSLDEAKKRLESSPGSLMVFASSTSGKLQILKRLVNGRMALIDPSQ
jgi:putative sigma-54 modulation protein